MHLILTGATGLVGSGVLDAMIKMKGITKISILSRRPVKMAEDAKDPRIHVIIHKNFEKYDSEVLSQLRGARGCVWALGISQTQVGKEEYIKITKDYTLAASDAFRTLASENEPFSFVYVSGNGATLEPGRFSPIFARVKGETELALAEMRKTNPWFHAMSARPAAIDPATHDAIKPYIPTPSFSIGIGRAVLGPAVRMWLPKLHSPTEELGRILTELAMGKHTDQFTGKDIPKVCEFPILENSAIRRLAASSE
ncbi:hypothetical protein DL768_003672 [Monosporascus sp. mg162]|nr:hypothetical protein DL768_003672 [Monosporascus sp. mg162]